MTKPQPTITTRLLEAGDLATIAGFEAEIARVSFPDDPVTDPGFYKRKLSEAVGQDGAIVVLSGGAIAGWAWVVPRENFVTSERYGDFRSLFVAPDYRGGPVVFALMRACLEYCAAHELHRITGRTHADNDAMQAIYKVFGFSPRHIVYERLLDDILPARPQKTARRSGGRRKGGGRSGRRTSRNRRP